MGRGKGRGGRVREGEEVKKKGRGKEAGREKGKDLRMRYIIQKRQKNRCVNMMIQKKNDNE